MRSLLSWLDSNPIHQTRLLHARPLAPPQSFALLAPPELQYACAVKTAYHHLTNPGMTPGSVKHNMPSPSLALLAPPGVNDHVEHKGYNNIHARSGGDSMRDCLLLVMATRLFWGL